MSRNGYLEKLFDSVIQRSDRKFALGEDQSCGAWILTFPVSDIPSNLEVRATPFWGGECQAIPVSLYNDLGGEVAYFGLTFEQTGDFERDAHQYVRICNLLPKLLSGFFIKRGNESHA